MQRLQKGSVIVWVVVIFMVLFLAGGFVWLYFRDKPATQTTSATTSSSNEPDIKVTDFSQGVPKNQTTEVLIKHPDSTFEKVILSNAMVDSYLKGLPPGETVVSKTPLK